MDKSLDQTRSLIADYEKEIAELVEIDLKNEGFHTIKAYNGLEALKSLEKEDIHIVVLDIMVPKTDGIEACLRIS